MVFSSAVFLFLFLPVVLAVYFLVPSRAAKNVLLLAASLVFYAWGEPAYVLLMIASMAANWLFGLKVDQERPNRRLWLAASLVFNLAVLGFFKYEGFLAHNVNAIVGATVIPDLELPLPIGISFYTLQAVSYVIDVYRGHVAPQRNALYLGMYIAMFPQLVAGPIVRYSTIEEQVLDRREDLRGFSSPWGWRRSACWRTPPPSSPTRCWPTGGGLSEPWARGPASSPTRSRYSSTSAAIPIWPSASA